MSETRTPQPPTASELAAALMAYKSEATFASLQTPRYRLDYSSWGEATAPPLVLIHGMADQKQSFAMLMQRLVEGGRRCIAYELADGRHDDGRLGRYGHDDFVNDLIVLLDHLNFDAVDLLGCSFGSTVSLRALALHPDRFRKVVLQGAFAHRDFTTLEALLAKIARLLPGTMASMPKRKEFLAEQTLPQLPDCPPPIFEFLLECGGRTPIRAASHRANILRKLDLRPLLPTIRHEVLMIGGDRDGLVPRSCEAELEAGLTNVQRLEIAPGGHYPQYAAPSTMADVMLTFLRGDNPAKASSSI